MNKTVVPKLVGGLGNQLFIMASAVDAANRWNASVVFHGTPGNPHCPDDLSLSVLFPDVPRSVIEKYVPPHAGIVSKIPNHAGMRTL